MNTPEDTPLHRYEDLYRVGTEVLVAVGMSADRAAAVAKTLIEADLMGHTTHGLFLLRLYIDSIAADGMLLGGEPAVVSDHGSSLAWDGQYLPGAWLTHRAIDEALIRIENHPVITVTIQRSHHIGSLASYLERATERGLVMLLSCSDPNSALVAPFGGVDPVYSPNPIAAGIPTSGDPILFDTSMSTTAWGVVNRAKQAGIKLPGEWLLDGEGNGTSDPNAIDRDPPATILPIGGKDHGYKGFALGLLVEALTSALGGHGRHNDPGRWGCSTFLQLIDPKAFGGSEAFVLEMDLLSQRCRESKPYPGESPVRLPGERALAMRRAQLGNGVQLEENVEKSLREMAERFSIAF